MLRAKSGRTSDLLCKQTARQRSKIRAVAVFIQLAPPSHSVFSRWMPRRAASVALWAVLVCWAGAIFWLSSMTPKELPEAAFLFSDKFNHFAAFAVGGWLAASALRVSRPQAEAAFLIFLAIALIAAFGAVDEMLQKLTPGRSGGDLYDWIADFLGAATGALSTLVTHGRLERLLTRP